MDAAVDPHARAAPRLLRLFLRAVWDVDPALSVMAAGVPRAVLANGALLLPAPPETAREAGPATGPDAQRVLRLATAAHAAAHLAHGLAPLDAGALKPLVVALVGVLEDARVESLAMREFPGLRRLWLPFHVADAGSGHDVATLLSRLARALLDPGHDDPHPWVRKARRLFADPADPHRCGIDGPERLRYVASLLGNDLGQMRVQFDARRYLVQPAYRDDNAHLWLSSPPGPDDATPLEAGGRAADAVLADLRAPAHSTPVARYPEWDRLIGRARPGWTAVHERPAGMASPGALQGLQAALRRQAALARRVDAGVAAALRARRPARHRTAADGDELHLRALVDARIAQRMRIAPDARVYRAREPALARGAVLILLDASASTAERTGEGTLLELGRLAALLCAGALDAQGQDCAVQAFSSNGREEVVVFPVKGFGQRADDPEVLARAAALGSRWSTRAGAAVRHACATLRARPAAWRTLVLVTDGEPHDVDVHDPRYLVDDLRIAARDAARGGVRVACLQLSRAMPAPAAPGDARALGAAVPPARLARLDRLGALPRRFAALLERAAR